MPSSSSSAASCSRPPRPVKRTEPLISHGSTRDVRLELDLLEQEESTTQHVSLRFTSEPLERRFQWYHEDISLPSSRWACAATIAALLLKHGGTIYQLETTPNSDSSSPRWRALVATLALNVVLAVAWTGLLVLSRRWPTMHGRFQVVLFASALCVVAIVLGQPVLAQPTQADDQELTQTMLFLLMLLSAIATLWNIQFLVYCALAGATAAALGAWLATSGGRFVRNHWHVVALLLVTLCSLGRSVYRSERGLRSKFLRIRHLLLENIKLTQQNTFMQQQLSSHVDAVGICGVEASSGSSGADAIEQSGCQSPSMVVLGESGMEHVLKVLHQLKLQLTGQEEMTRELEYVMQTLTSDQDLFRGSQQQQQNLFRSLTSRRYSPGGGGGGAGGPGFGLSRHHLNEGSEEWLHLIDEQRHQWRRRKSVEMGIASPLVSPTSHVVKPLRRTTSGFRQTVLKQVDNYLVAGPKDHCHQPKWSAKRLLARAKACDAEVDLLDFAAVCLYPLTSVLLTTLEAHNLFVALPIRLEAAAEFALEIESRYQAKNPYHNATHGAFVVWDINFFLRRLHVELTPLQVLSALIAGAVHDVNHPGLSNAYLVTTSSPLAIKYSDDAVLERMHLAEAFQACTKEGCDVFEGLSKEQRRQSRKLIVTMVLATDLSGHLKHVNKLKSKRYVAMQTQSSSDLAVDAKLSAAAIASPCVLTDADDLVFQTIIMMADLGHAAKSFAQHFAWSKLVTEEFFRQGDIERQFRMPLSPLCDREAAKFDKSQVGFLEFVVLPLYTAARDVLPLHFDGILERIHANNAMWKHRAESAETGRTPPLEIPSIADHIEVVIHNKASPTRRVSTMAQLVEEEGDGSREDEEDEEEEELTADESGSDTSRGEHESSAVVEASLLSTAVDQELEQEPGEEASSST